VARCLGHVCGLCNWGPPMRRRGLRLALRVRPCAVSARPPGPGAESRPPPTVSLEPEVVDASVSAVPGQQGGHGRRQWHPPRRPPRSQGRRLQQRRLRAHSPSACGVRLEVPDYEVCHWALKQCHGLCYWGTLWDLEQVLWTMGARLQRYKLVWARMSLRGLGIIIQWGIDI